MADYVIAFLLAVIATVALTPVVIYVAGKTGALDAPDARKVHKKPIPRIGGVAIYLGFALAMLYYLLSADVSRESVHELFGLLIGGSLIVFLGLVDDYKNLPAKVKLLGQIVCASILVIGFDVRIDFISDPFGDYFYLEYFAIPATIFWIVGLTNTVNLIDGLDGLAAGVAMIASLTICIVALEQNAFFIAIMMAGLAGSALGFLFYNFNPARIFMGDTGSMFLGYILAGVSVIGAVKSAATIALIVPILALGLPILDTTFAIVRRYRGGVPIFKPDKGHLHHRLLNMGFTQRQAVLLMYVISALLGLSAIALTEVSGGLSIVIIVVVVFGVVYGTRKLGILRLHDPSTGARTK